MTPTPKLGELWRTRDGRKCFVSATSNSGLYNLSGIVEGDHDTRWWMASGRHHAEQEESYDLISPWSESKPGFLLKWYGVGEVIPAGSRYVTMGQDDYKFVPRQFLYEVPCD